MTPEEALNTPIEHFFENIIDLESNFSSVLTYRNFHTKNIESLEADKLTWLVADDYDGLMVLCRTELPIEQQGDK